MINDRRIEIDFTDYKSCDLSATRLLSFLCVFRQHFLTSFDRFLDGTF